MKFLSGGGMPDDCLFTELQQLGHEVVDLPEHNWYLYYRDGKSEPVQWGEALLRGIEEHRPDVLLVSKGGLFRNGNLWAVDAAALWAARARCKLLYLSYDDPAFSPIALQDGIVAPFHYWGTSCPGIATLFQNLIPSRFRGHLFESWLAWDRRIAEPMAEADFECDVVVTGSPYWMPFPEPHYRGGFRTIRRDLVRAFVAAGLRVNIWGTDQWLDPNGGGDPAFAPMLRGFLPPDQIHRVHASAKVCAATHLVDGYRYDSGRLPWVLGAGGVLLHERRAGLAEEFGDMVEWFEPGDVKEAADRAKMLVDDPARRASMRQRGRAYVLQHHTWANRAQTIVDLLEAPRG